MREAIGGAWLLGIVMTFIVLFASFLAVSINYSKAFKVKNNVVDFIEKNEGMNEDAGTDIWNYLQSQGYILKGNCESGYTGFDWASGSMTTTTNGNKSLFCVKKNKPKNSETGLDKSYYSVQVFFRLDLPIFGEIFTFKVTGETMSIYFPNDGKFARALG